MPAAIGLLDAVVLPNVLGWLMVVVGIVVFAFQHQRVSGGILIAIPIALMLISSSVGPTVVDSRLAATEVRKSLIATGVWVDDPVDCTAAHGKPVTPGATYDCRATRYGTGATVHVMITDNAGHFRWSIE